MTAPHLLRPVLASRAVLCAAAFAAAPLPGQTDLNADRDVVALDRFLVEDQRSDAYTSAVADVVSKLPVPLLENPQNIQVIPRVLLDDQGALKLDDVLKNVAGVMPGGYYDNWDYYRIRGFSADFNTYIDGLRGGNGMGEETFGLEQVEVVKGPASSLFGAGPLSGLVNLVSKRPRAERFGKVELSHGSFGYGSASLDYNTPLGSGENRLFRLPVVYSSQDSFTDRAEKQTFYAGPAFTWRLGASTSLTLLGKYRATDVVHAMPLPAAGTVLPNPNGHIPSHRFVGEPGSDHAYENSGQLGYEFSHRFSDALTLRQNVRYDRFVQGWRDLLYPGYLGADQRTLYRYPYNYWQDWHDFGIDTRLEAALGREGFRHEVLAGVDQYRKTYSARWQTIDFSDPAGYIGIDLFNPVYGTPIPAYQPIAASRENTFNTGFYLHDHVSLAHGVSVTAGGRYDFSKKDGVRVEAFTPRLGFTWQVRRGIALYANYAESFEPQPGTTAAGGPVDPETGTNWEAGVKTAAPDGRLTATVALYQLTRQNIATADLAHPGAVLVAGEQRSRGFEFDGRFSPAPGWELTAAYAYTDARITRDNTLPVGARTPGVPYHSLNLWTKYRFQSGALKNFGVGLGGRAYSAQAADETYVAPFRIPGYGLVDAALYYRAGRFSAQVNVTNLLDREYYSGAYDALYVLPGEPRGLRVTAGWAF